MCCCAIVFAGFVLGARDMFSQDELKMLEDPGGWQYISISDADAGIQTTHTCFDGRTHPDQCSGSLTLNPDNTFVQQVHIHGQTVARHGKYQLDGAQIAFFDEFGNKDGPYQLTLDSKAQRLILEMPQVRDELELTRHYEKRRARARGNPPPQ